VDTQPKPQGEQEEDCLTRRFREGDSGALRALLERHGSTLRARIDASLPRRLRRRVSVSDVLQESCIVALRRKSELEERGENGFRNWMLGIVDRKTREAIRHHDGTAKRAARREVTRTKRPDTHQMQGRHATPSKIAVANELAALAQEAFDRLPADYREILRLTRVEDLDLTAVATRIGRSHDAAKKLAARALRRYRELLDELRGERHG
jgi:RNA polymerase sigma-70 factor (subfamily 1)